MQSYRHAGFCSCRVSVSNRVGDVGLNGGARLSLHASDCWLGSGVDQGEIMKIHRRRCIPSCVKSILLSGALTMRWFAFSTGAADIPFTVEEPSGVPRRSWPVTSGIPLARGILFEAGNTTLLAEDHQPQPLQTDVLARWPDGSVRWLLLDFQADLAAKQKRQFTLRTGSPSSARSISTSIQVNTHPDRLVIVTGPLRLELCRDGFDPLGAVWLDRNADGRFGDGERLTSAGRGGLFVVDAQPRRYEAAQAPADIVVEESGPLRACVRVSGRHAARGGSIFRYVLRLHAFRGQPFVRSFYTFINDHPDALITSIKELGFAIGLAPEPGAAQWQLLDGRRVGGGRVFQVDERHYTRDGEVAGAQAAGWAAVGTQQAGLAVGLRQFWQHWPKSIEVQPGAVILGLCPDFSVGLYDGKPLAEENKLYYALRHGRHTFKAGLAKTHELWATFFAGPPDSAALAGFFQAAEEPLLATCAPAYVSATKAAGEFPPANPGQLADYDRWFERALTAHLKRRDQVREYGMLNFGDWYGEREVNWGNLEYDLAAGMFQQYLRTGDRRFFDRGESAARHHIDVDTVHATNRYLMNPFGSPPRVGEVWLHSVGHTGGYYTNAPLPVEAVYQVGHSANYGHIWITGDLDYYYLTGDRRAREVALQVADMMASGMTSKVGTHIRTLGWPTILVLAAYEATGKAKYIEAATKNWEVLKQSLDPQRGWVVRLASDHCLHPLGSTRAERDQKYHDQRCQGNVPFMEGLTLCALARYHRHTGDPEVLRALTVGIDQMIRECWQEDMKTFRYTACPLSAKTPYGLFLLSAEAMAVEARLTGNREHQRILCEGFQAALRDGASSAFGKSLGQMTFFAPFALEALESRP